MEKVYDHVTACSSLKGRISDMKVMEDFESRPHKAVTFCSRKRKGKTGMERAKIAEGASWTQRKTTRKKHGREGRGEGEECKRSEQRQGRNERIEVIRSSQRMAQLVINERMSQGERVKNPKVKKKVPGWSIEEMKEKTSFAEEERKR